VKEDTINNTYDRKVWYVLNNSALGGAERRMIKVASRVASLNLYKNVCLLINEALWQEYQKDSELISKIESSGLQIKTVADYNPVPFWVKIFSKVSHRFGLFNSFTNYLLLKKKSWYSTLYDATSENDIVHCFAGDESRNGALILVSKGRKVVLEITNNRYLEHISSQLVTIFAFIDCSSINGRLYLQCVSETVLKNFAATLGENIIGKRCVRMGCYSGPFLLTDNRLPHSLPEKNNVIIFGHRFIGPKNPILFCHAVKNMIESGELEGWHVKIRGKGSLEKEMRTVLGPYIEKGVVDISFSYNLEKELRKSKIFVSLISTGSYPSQSVFEAMQNGNLLVLADTGETKLHFNHQFICFAELNIESLQKCLRNAIADTTSEQFIKKSEAMVRFYESFADKECFLNDILYVYQQK